MAAGGSPDSADFLGQDNWDRIKKRRRFRELFHGRFPDKQCATLLTHFRWDLETTVSFVLDGSPQEIREIIGEDEWQIVGARRDNVLRDLARRNAVGAEIRQFGCAHCDNMWWRKVPARKPVARCKLCTRRYDPIPENQEYGWAKFQCICGNEFHAFGMLDLSILEMELVGRSKSICYRCSRICEPVEIMKPLKRDRPPPRRYTHRCTAHNCYNRCLPQPNQPIIFVCVHPNSLQRKVFGEGSDLHVSTGSTVKTFLTQDELMEPYSPYEPSLAPTIEEGSSDEGSSGGDNQ